MNTKIFWVGGLIILMLVVSIGAVSASQGADFEGAWSSEDVDGSHMWLWTFNHFGAYELIWFDEACTACTGIWGDGPSCLILASGHKSDPNTLQIDGGQLYCYWDEGTELLEGIDVTGTQIYDQTADQVTHTNNKGYFVSWTRTNDKKPEKVIDPLPYSKP